MKLNAIKITTLNPAKIGFQIRMKDTMVPIIPRPKSAPQFLLPYFLMSIANPMVEIERNNTTKPI